MEHLVRLDRSYDPETIAAMSAAFEMNCQFISKRMNDSADVKKTLAVIIVRLVDQGEHDPERLTEAVFREWTGSDRSAIGDRWATAREAASASSRNRSP